MDIFSFCLKSSFNSSNTIDHHLLTEYSNKYGSFIAFTQKAASLNILLSGQVNIIRSELLRNNPIKSILNINSIYSEALYHTEIKTSLSKIAQKNNIEIEVHATSEPEIHMIGSIDTIEFARVEILVLLDQLSGLQLDTINDIPLHFHGPISGRKHAQLQSIMEETSTNIYLQSPFTNLCSLDKNDEIENTIYITGESTTSINRAKELLSKLNAQKSKSIYHKDSVMDPKKIDWILLNKRTELRKIMRDNASSFLFPILGSGENSISIYAENRINVERSIRLLNYLTSNIYEASFEFIKSDTSLIKRAFGGDVNKFSSLLSELSLSSGADILFNSKSSKLELFGTERHVRNAYQLLCDMVFFKENHQFTTFALELATDQREFISGKKNGKINKIMKSCAVTIRFKVSNEYNSSIIVESDDYVKALDGLTMLQDELPAETSFYVPENYHRRIIGVAGKNIQKVMKKYGVYVKFSGAEEFNSMGGYFENEDNVVARTPMKNQMNLENLKHSVTEFITFQKDKDYTFATMRIPYWLHRTIPSQYGSQLREICRTNNAKIWWPERLGSDEVIIYGPQSQIPSIIIFMESLIATDNHIVVRVESEEMKNKLLESKVISSLQKKAKSANSIELNIHHLDQSSTKEYNNKLQWKSSYKGNDLIVYRFMQNSEESNNSIQDVQTLIKSFIESKGFVFNQVTENKSACNTTPLHQNIDSNTIDSPTTTFINTSLLTILSSPSLPIISTNNQPELHSFDSNISNNLAILDIPSPPLSESQYLQYHPFDHFGISSSLLSAPQPTGKNIWASPRMQSNTVIPPTMKMESMRFGYQALTPLSPPHQDSFITNKSHISITPSFSAPIIGSNTDGRQQRHKSWPDAFFGGRDLFDTLPIRRASANTQHAFEFIPNSTTVDYGHKSLPTNKYQNEFNAIAHQTPFIYANAPINNHSQAGRRSQGFNM